MAALRLMTRENANDAEPNTHERVALDWLAKCDRGLTPAQEIEFECWLAADGQNRKLFDEFERTWTLFNGLRLTPQANVAGATLDPDVFRRANTTPRAPIPAQLCSFPPDSRRKRPLAGIVGA